MYTSVTAARAPAPPGPRLTLGLLRTLAVLLLLAVLVQPVLAGLYLSGDWDALGVHSANATIVQSLSFFLLVSALVYWLAGGGRVALAAAVLFVSATPRRRPSGCPPATANYR